MQCAARLARARAHSVQCTANSENRQACLLVNPAMLAMPAYTQCGQACLLLKQGDGTFLHTTTRKSVVRLPWRSWSENLLNRWSNAFQYGSLSGTPLASLKSAFLCFSKVAKTCVTSWHSQTEPGTKESPCNTVADVQLENMMDSQDSCQATNKIIRTCLMHGLPPAEHSRQSMA